MTACPPACGGCCDPVTLSPRAWERLSASPLEDEGSITRADQDFAREHWSLLRTMPDTEQLPGRQPPYPGSGDTELITCAKFDRDTRACTAYDDRPPICSNYPFYDRTPQPGEWLDGLTCVFHDDVPGRRVLPLTVL